jgi:hypothetical protein
LRAWSRVAAHALLVHAGVGQDLGAERTLRTVQARPPASRAGCRLAAGPAVVLGQLGQALVSERHRRPSFVHQVVAVRETRRISVQVRSSSSRPARPSAPSACQPSARLGQRGRPVRWRPRYRRLGRPA